MSKIEFFNELEKCLKSFHIENIDEILRDYEEYFIESAQMGKTEQEIISSLGNPAEIAKNYNGENKNRNVKAEKAVLSYNLKIVTANCVMYTMLFVACFVAAIVLSISSKSFIELLVMLPFDLGFLGLSIYEFKKLKKYKKAQKDLNNIEKKDI